MSKLLSIVIQAYNEEANIANTAKTVLDLMDAACINCELVFVSDGSKDATFDKIQAEAQKDRRVRGVEFSRNFGKEAANICAVFVEESYRSQGIAGRLLDMAVEDLRIKGISPVYLLTDHIGFYERYGWEFLCMVQGNGESEMSRMYIHN